MSWSGITLSLALLINLVNVFRQQSPTEGTGSLDTDWFLLKISVWILVTNKYSLHVFVLLPTFCTHRATLRWLNFPPPVGSFDFIVPYASLQRNVNRPVYTFVICCHPAFYRPTNGYESIPFTRISATVQDERASISVYKHSVAGCLKKRKRWGGAAC